MTRLLHGDGTQTLIVTWLGMNFWDARTQEEDEMVVTRLGFVVTLVVVVFVGSLRADQSAQTSKPVTNGDVIAMETAGLSDDVIVNAIQQTQTIDFDLSPSALIDLKRAGVSDYVIKTIQDKSRTLQPGPATAPPTAGTGPDAAERRSSGPCRIFITEDDPPSGAYVMVKKEIQVGKKFYGDHDDDLMRELAKQASKVGADAIIRFHEWRAPSAWSWAAAKAGGMAVRWTDQGKGLPATLTGQCWDPKEQKSQ
jgi:hypothetical protein